MEKLLEAGKAKSIGISNFTASMIKKVFIDGKTKYLPAVNQVELHPRLAQPKLKAYCEKLGIRIVAYSPLGHGVIRKGTAHLLEDPVITKIAEKHGKSPAQVLIRWSWQNGNIVIPKSVKADRIATNFDVRSFTLSADEIKAIDALDEGEAGRFLTGWLPKQFEETEAL
eukprot:TRINITY_DN46539_c0_g1_i2.p1 TRINITY_DN46539_c0_g1~~TRINITY_DN46539_c0_g1_i2.p1  ORF type:complete len:180 (+),score=45.86 TRINITY_DN46539_c0_g1_i2:36-542(+)